MGNYELEDQVKALEMLIEQGIVDKTRVGITGWSYGNAIWHFWLESIHFGSIPFINLGGYLSLNAISKRSDLFKIAVCGAPVVLWEGDFFLPTWQSKEIEWSKKLENKAYDTGYTERYLKTPQSNPQGYRESSILSYVTTMPNEEDRVVLVHGLKDENGLCNYFVLLSKLSIIEKLVHFSNTAQLIDAMNATGKPYKLQVYPNERHGLRNPINSLHSEINLLKTWAKL